MEAEAVEAANIPATFTSLLMTQAPQKFVADCVKVLFGNGLWMSHAAFCQFKVGEKLSSWNILRHDPGFGERQRRGRSICTPPNMSL